MNFAFGTLLVILLLAPGLILFKSYFSYPFSKSLLPSNPVNDFTKAIIPSIALHLLFIFIIHLYPSYKVSFPIIGFLLLNIGKSENSQLYFENIQENLGAILSYHLSLWVVAWMLGTLARIIVRACGLDTKYRFFRFNNEWYYILSGEILKFPYVIHRKLSSIDIKFIDALVKTDKGSYIFVGLLQDYHMTNDGKLDSICLSNVRRRKIENDYSTDPEEDIPQMDKYYHIPGSIFIIPYSTIININIHYIELQELEFLRAELEDEHAQSAM